MGRKRVPLVLDLRPLQCGYAERGIGRYTREIATRIARRFPQARSLVFHADSPPLSSLPPVIRAPRVRRQWLWDQTALPMRLGRLGVRLFHNFVALGPLAEVSFPVLYASRTLATVHDLHMFHPEADALSRFYRTRVRIQLQRGGLRRVLACAVNSHTTLNEVRQLCGLPVNSFLFTPLGADHMAAPAGEGATPGGNGPGGIAGGPGPQGGAGDGQEYVLTVGDAPTKNLALGLRILRALRRERPAPAWCIVGHRDRVLATLPDLPHHDWIEVVENPGDSRLARLYRGATFLLMTSQREGFGIPLVEAMACGCPVLAGAIPPLREITGWDSGLDPNARSQDAVNAWVDAARRLLDSPQARQSNIQRGARQSRLYRWDRAMEPIVDLYQRILGA